MKKIALTLLLYTTPLFTFNTDFLRRFGPNSPIYNEPLYFATQRFNHPKKRKEPLKVEKRITRLKRKVKELENAA